MRSKSQKIIETALKWALYLVENVSPDLSQVELPVIYNLPVESLKKVFILSEVEGSPPVRGFLHS